MRWRNKFILCCAALVFCGLLTACGPTGDPTPTQNTGSGTVSPPSGETDVVTVPSDTATEPATNPVTEPSTLPGETEPTTVTPKPTEPSSTEPTVLPEPVFPTVEEKLEILSYGRYSGAFVEDGSDEQVQNVAVMLVKNNSDDYLDYAQIVMDIDGQAGRFVVMGLPPGECAWVLEKDRMTIGEDAVFHYANGATGFKSVEDPNTLPISVTGYKGQLTLVNTGDEILPDVYVYYKVRHTDGNFLGGILYRKSFGNLEPGEAVSELAGHFDPEKAEIVRITWNKET